MRRLSFTALVCLFLLAGAVVSRAQDSAWERLIAAGRDAWEHGRYAEAEEKFNAALLEAAVCGHGTADDQTMCVEGAIEKLGEYDEGHALAACAKLEGELASVCRAAAEEKMYRLSKPFFSLYFAQ